MPEYYCRNCVWVIQNHTKIMIFPKVHFIDIMPSKKYVCKWFEPLSVFCIQTIKMKNEPSVQCICILVKLDSNLVTLLFWGKKINGGWTFELMICEMCFCLFFISVWKPPSLPTTQIRIEWYCNSTLDHHIIIIIIIK